MSWLDPDTLLLSSAWGGDVTTSGYARTVRLWRRGSDAAQAPVLFEVPRESMSAGGGVDLEHTSKLVWYVEHVGFFDVNLWMADGEGGNRVKLDLPTDVEMLTHHNWMAIKPRKAWTVAGKTWPADTLLGIRLDAFMAGGRDFTVLFEPAGRRVLQGFFWSAGRLVLSILDNLQPVFEVLTPSDDGWARQGLTGLPAIGVVDMSPLDVEASESNGDLVATVQDPLTPHSLMLLAEGKGPVLLKRSSPAFSPEGLVVTRHEAISIDGERIPYTQTGPAGETGDAPVHLTGYGGFRLPSMPYYNASIGKMWLERGGTSVIANIRGGGEFGTPWHDAGRGAGKRLAHDDFAAVAADLVRRGVTRPGRIAAEGGSNGGILITNMLTRYPERFGALFCTIPLIDMRRYSKLLAGASWIAEYGDPDKPEEWAWLKTYSAYHQAVPGQAYPPILIATTRRDDRVHPGHARKMTAKLAPWATTRSISTSPRRAATATARTTRNAPPSRRWATRSSSRRSAGRAEPLGQHDVRPAGTVHVGQQPDDLIAVPAIEGEGVPARRRLCRRDVAHHVGPEVAAEQARAAVVVVAAEEERQHALAAGAGLECRQQRRADAAALAVRRHDQGMDLPAVAISPDRADPADQPLALQGGMAQPVAVGATQCHLGFGLAGCVVG